MSDTAAGEPPPSLRPAATPAAKPVRRTLPEQLPREEIVHSSPCACPVCGGALRAAGEDVAEMLEWVPGRYKVLRHVRPKFACLSNEHFTVDLTPHALLQQAEEMPDNDAERTPQRARSALFKDINRRSNQAA